MRASSQEQRSSGSIRQMYHPNLQQFEPYGPYCSSPSQVSNSNQGVQLSFQNSGEEFNTLESAPASNFVVFSSPPAVSVSSNRSTFSPQCSQSYTSYENTYNSPISGSSGVDDSIELRHALRELEYKLLGPESDLDDSCSCSHQNVVSEPPSLSRWNQMIQMAPEMDLKQMLVACAEAVSESDTATAQMFLELLEPKVSVSGEPVQRLSAYMMEGLRARLLSSGSIIYQESKCNQPTSSELMSYMSVLYEICPYYKFAYYSANVVISEAMANENRIHIIDFQIAQGSQWVFLIQAMAKRFGGAPFIRVTGVDDSQSATARGGGLGLVGQRLAKVAESCGVRFEFHAAGMSGCEVELENLHILPGEALAVNFPYMLHHMPDESVNTMNHRDRLLRLVKSLSPKVVTLAEQESNTNTAPFYPRFCETLEYYMAMFESIDAGRPRNDKQRIRAEEHCVARDIVNIIACEGPERVERHELYGKWRMRLTMAGFTQCPLSSAVRDVARGVLKDYSKNYGLGEKEGALFLGWKNRALVTFSAWR